jgi:hypothetical protein
VQSKDGAARPTSIDLKDLDPVLSKHQGNSIFAEALAKSTDAQSLLAVLSQFVEFNSVFGAGVAMLAGEIAYRKDVFRDPLDIDATADRSCDVAASIYFAAVDEFSRSKTHRSMAADTLRGAVKFLGFSDDVIQLLTAVCPATKSGTEKVSHGYCRAKSLTTADVFRGIGFHIGSEVLATQEFDILNSYLHEKHPDLVRYLKSTRSYTWVAVHPAAEQDHFEESLEGANRALRYFVDKAQAKSWILEGFANFAAVQLEFMNSLRDLSDGRFPQVFESGEQAG